MFIPLVRITSKSLTHVFEELVAPKAQKKTTTGNYWSSKAVELFFEAAKFSTWKAYCSREIVVLLKHISSKDQKPMIESVSVFTSDTDWQYLLIMFSTMLISDLIYLFYFIFPFYIISMLYLHLKYIYFAMYCIACYCICTLLYELGQVCVCKKYEICETFTSDSYQQYKHTSNLFTSITCNLFTN